MDLLTSLAKSLSQDFQCKIVESATELVPLNVSLTFDVIMSSVIGPIAIHMLSIVCMYDV